MKASELIPVLVVGGVGFYLYRSGMLGNLLSDITGPIGPAYNLLPGSGGGIIQGPTRAGNLPSDAVSSGADGSTTPWYDNRVEYQASITVLPTEWRTNNAQALMDVEQIASREGIPGNEQILRASYEWLWANRLPYLLLPVREWGRLRAEYGSRYGKDVSVDSNLGPFALSLDQVVSPIEYQGMVRRNRERLGLPVTGLSGMGLGCGRSPNCNCGGGGRRGEVSQWA